MKRSKYIFFLLSGVFVFWSCSGSELPGDSAGHVSTQSLALSVSDRGFQDDSDMQTRTVMDDYPTTFVAGDKIGLFAVESGSLVDGIENLCLTAVDDGNGGINWDVENGYKLTREDVTYFAYFPYLDGFTDVYAADDDAFVFFSDLTYDWEPDIDQSTYDKYKAQDLMLSKGSITENKLSFTMEHGGVLAILDVASNTRFFNFSPYQMSDGKYYYLMNYGYLTGEYTNADNVVVRWRFEVLMDPGYCHLYTIDGGSAAE